MVENRPLLTVFTHVVLILGVIVVAFPLYVTFVASTLTLDQILSVPIPPLPGDQFLKNYSQVLTAGSTKGSGAAARIDGAGPMRFFREVLLPLSKTSIAALFVIQFIYGWNQYLWPLLITNQESMYTTVIGIRRMIVGGDAANEWQLIMATAMLALLPPAAVVILMQKWFVKGLVETEK